MALVAGLIIAAVAGLGGAMMTSGAASDAADAQAGAAGNATEEQRRQFNATQARLKPWSDAGTESIYKLADLLGLKIARGTAPTKNQFTHVTSGGTGLAGGYWAPAGTPGGTTQTGDQRSPGSAQTFIPTPPVQTFDQTGYDKALADWQASQPVAGPDTGSLLKTFTGADLTSEPGYEFRRSQGELGINRNASATGMRLSPATQKALLRFNSDYASTEFGNAFNRDLASKQNTYNMLTGVSQAGTGAATNIGVLGQQTATQIGENTMGAANAQAAGQVASANAYAGALNNGANQFVNYAYLDKYLGSGRSGSASSSPYLP